MLFNNYCIFVFFFFFFSSRRRHTRLQGDWSSDVCSSDLESLTDQLEREAEGLFAEIQSVGGVVKGMESRWFQRQMARSAGEVQRGVEAGARILVGVKDYLSADGHPVEFLKVSDAAAEEKRRRLRGR